MLKLVDITMLTLEVNEKEIAININMNQLELILI